MKSTVVLSALICCGVLFGACSQGCPPKATDPRLAVFDFLREKIRQGHVGEVDFYVENPALFICSLPKNVRPLIRDTAESVLHSDGRIYDKALKRHGVRLFIWDVSLDGADKASAKAAYYFGYDGGTEYEVSLRLERGVWKVENTAIRVQS